jgi:hypothetical protein
MANTANRRQVGGGSPEGGLEHTPGRDGSKRGKDDA